MRIGPRQRPAIVPARNEGVDLAAEQGVSTDLNVVGRQRTLHQSEHSDPQPVARTARSICDDDDVVRAPVQERILIDISHSPLLLA